MHLTHDDHSTDGVDGVTCGGVDPFWMVQSSSATTAQDDEYDEDDMAILAAVRQEDEEKEAAKLAAEQQRKSQLLQHRQEAVERCEQEWRWSVGRAEQTEYWKMRTAATNERCAMQRDFVRDATYADYTLPPEYSYELLMLESDFRLAIVQTYQADMKVMRRMLDAQNKSIGERRRRQDATADARHRMGAQLMAVHGHAGSKAAKLAAVRSVVALCSVASHPSRTHHDDNERKTRGKNVVYDTGRSTLGKAAPAYVSPSGARSMAVLPSHSDDHGVPVKANGDDDGGEPNASTAGAAITRRRMRKVRFAESWAHRRLPPLEDGLVSLHDELMRSAEFFSSNDEERSCASGGNPSASSFFLTPHQREVQRLRLPPLFRQVVSRKQNETYELLEPSSQLLGREGADRNELSSCLFAKLLEVHRRAAMCKEQLVMVEKRLRVKPGDMKGMLKALKSMQGGRKGGSDR